MNRNYMEKFAVLSALMIIFFLGFFSILDKSMTWDEKCYIGAGKYIFKTGNFEYDIFRSHPPLSFYINSIFLLPFRFEDKIYSNDNCWEIGYDMVYHSGYDPRLVLTLARLPFIIMSMILALYVFFWAKQIYGVKSGFLALGLYTFSTSIISFSNLALTDFAVTFFIFLTMYYYWKLATLNKKKYLYLASLFFGLSLLTKITSFVLIPILTLFIFYDSLKNKKNKKNLLSAIKKLFTIFMIGFIVLFVGFGLQFKPLKSAMPDHYVARAYEEFNKQIENDFLRRTVMYTFEEIPIPFPAYFFNIGAVGYSSKGIYNIFLNGRIFSESPWHYPLLVFFYKTQISLFIILILSLIFFNELKLKNKYYEFILIFPVMAIFLLFMLSDSTSGLRHILPIYPFLFVFCSKIAKSKKVWLNIVLIILMTDYIIGFLLIFPHYAAYFNIFAGGPSNGYKVLLASNLDLGQDLPGLKKFMIENNIEKVNLSYFGSIDPKEYVSYDYMPSPYFQHWVPDYIPFVTLTEREEDCSEREGWVAISASNLQNVHIINKTCFDWLKKHEPVTKIGYSIFIYNLSD